MGLETATAVHWQQFFPALPEPVCWFGLTLVEANTPVSIGCIYEGQDDRWWAAFAGRRATLPMVRGAREMLDFAAERGLLLHAVADPSVPRAVAFMRRFAFQPTGEMIAPDHEVYRWTP